MRNLNLKIIVFFILSYFFNGPGVNAQFREPPVFQKIDQKNGLSDNDVQCVYEDQKGFMWVGTASGLNLLDGSDITIFKHLRGNIHSISNNNIKAITGDTSGIIWIGTQEGLNSFDPLLRKFTVHPLRKDIGIKNDYIVSLAVDKKNNLFIASSSGLYYYVQKSGEFSHIDILGDHREKLLNNTLTHIAVDKNGILWLTTFNGLWSYDENSKTFTHAITHANDPEFTRLFTYFIISHTGKLWIGTWDKGIKEYDPVLNEVTTWGPDSTKNLNVGSLSEIKQNNGKYILCVNGNSLGLEPGKHRLFHWVDSFRSASDAATNVLFTSENNWLWMGKRDGLYYYNPAKDLILHRRFQGTITDQDVPVLEWQDKILVAGIGDNFLRTFDENLNEINNFSNNSTKNISCLSMRFYDKNRIKAGTSAGIADINLARGKINFTQLPDSINKSSTLNFITTLIRDKTRNWWVFPWRNGVWLTDSVCGNPPGGI